MTVARTASGVNVEIIPALPEQEPILANMFELYAHDFSEFIDLELGADGRFGCKDLSSYWKEPGRYPFLIKANGHLAGFVFVSKGSLISGDEDVWDMTDFFIVRRYRRLRVGMKVAHGIWKQFPGNWEVRVLDRNQRANEFWRRAIDESPGKTIDSTSFTRNGERWNVFSFESKRSA